MHWIERRGARVLAGLALVLAAIALIEIGRWLLGW